VIDDGDCAAIGGMKIGKETEVLGENLPSLALSTTNPGSNTGRRGGKPATNRLSYGAAISFYTSLTFLRLGQEACSLHVVFVVELLKRPRLL
jgi:hypothetical protein